MRYVFLPRKTFLSTVPELFRHMNKRSVSDGIIIFPKYWISVTEKQGDYIEGL